MAICWSTAPRFQALMRSQTKIAPRRRRAASFLVDALVLAAAIAGLCGCSLPLDDIGAPFKTGTVRASTLQQMAGLNMDRAAPIVLRLYKTESILEVWKENRDGKYALLKSYPICKFSGKLGPKIREGDHQAPEGFYEITPTQLNPRSREYLAFNIGFPNAFDRSLGRTGSVVMVHGGCHSIGCYAMTNQNIDEIYALIGEAFGGGQEKVQLEAFPFRMTAENLASHAENNPNAAFWAMLKTGSDVFLEERKPPTVAVCGHRYVFNADAADAELDPNAPCPPGIAPSVLADDLEPAKSNFATARVTEQAPIRHRAAIARKRTLYAASAHRRAQFSENAGARHWQRIAATDGQALQRLRRHGQQGPRGSLASY
jgi:murein L,D-transpeptidase YafK